MEKCSNIKEETFVLKELRDILKPLKRGKATGPDMYPAEVFIEGGQVLDKELLEMLNEIKENLKTPSQWNEVGITTIYKNKGSRKKLVNYRGVFLTSVISKIFERLITGRIKKAMENMNKLQAGGIRNRSTYDQTFLLRTFIGHAKYTGKPLFLTLYDYKQCFDNLWLDDALLSMWKLGVKSDMLALIHKMNEKSTVTVKTPLGRTDSFEIPYICKQGTVLIPPMCSASVAECCDEQRKGGASIGALTVRSLAFMDDLLGMNETIRDVHTSHENVTFFSKKKKAPLNEDKCICMVINSKSPHPHPILAIKKKIMKIVEESKSLGDVFNSKGNNKSLLRDRKNKATRCLISCLSECYTVTRGAKAIKSLLLLYITVYLPTIIFNCEAWDNLTGEDMKLLQVLQMKFLKRVLQVPKSTPNCLVLLELGITPIELVIKSRQLNFLHHILNLSEDDPVKMAYYEQKSFSSENNWAREIKNTLARCGLSESEEEIAAMSKVKWKEVVSKQIKSVALKELNEKRKQLKNGSVVDEYDSLETQEYFQELNAQDSRTLFKIRAEVYDMKEYKQFKYDDTICRL